MVWQEKSLRRNDAAAARITPAEEGARIKSVASCLLPGQGVRKGLQGVLAVCLLDFVEGPVIERIEHLTPPYFSTLTHKTGPSSSRIAQQNERIERYERIALDKSG